MLFHAASSAMLELFKMKSPQITGKASLPAGQAAQPARHLQLGSSLHSVPPPPAKAQPVGAQSEEEARVGSGVPGSTAQAREV